MALADRGGDGLRSKRPSPSPPPGGNALIYIVIMVTVMVATLVLGHQLRDNLSGLFGESKLNHRCSGYVNRWANSRLDGYRQQLEAQHHGSQLPGSAPVSSGTQLINWFDRLITERTLDQQRLEILNTTLRTYQCRPVFE